MKIKDTHWNIPKSHSADWQLHFCTWHFKVVKDYLSPSPKDQASIIVGGVKNKHTTHTEREIQGKCWIWFTWRCGKCNPHTKVSEHSFLDFSDIWIASHMVVFLKVLFSFWVLSFSSGNVIDSSNDSGGNMGVHRTFFGGVYFLGVEH